MLPFSARERQYPGNLGFDTTIIRSQKDQAMRRVQILTSAVFMGLLTACSTPQEDASKAQAGVAKQRLELVDKYQVCVKEAAGDNLKIEACDSYLRAAEALR
jgi:hypothetical protein